MVKLIGIKKGSRPLEAIESSFNALRLKRDWEAAGYTVRLSRVA
jgi:hypothetical protein